MSPENLDYGREAREAALDNGGFTQDFINKKMGHTSLSGSVEPPRPLGPKRKERPTGHVRGFRDADLRDGELYKSEGPLTEEQLEINHRGHQNVRAAMGDKIIQGIEDRVNQRIPLDPDNRAKSLADRERLLNAMLRTHFDRKN